MSRKCSNLSGMRFGSLVAKERVDDYISPNGYRQVQWLCECDCGRTSVVTANHLKRGNTVTCGFCAANEYEKRDGYYAGILANGVEFYIDEQDLETAKAYQWWSDSNGYIRARGESGKRVRLHRLIMNPKPGYVVDHINGNRRDNRRSNLRLCTPNENCRNHGISTNNSSGSTGVSYFERNQKWVAYIAVDGMNFHIGSFDTYEQAVSARKAAEQEYYKEFARTAEGEGA